MKKKVGRPAVSEKRKPRSFKATDTEWQAIQQMAAERGLSASEYLRNVALGKEENYMKKKMNWNETFDVRTTTFLETGRYCPPPGKRGR